MLALVEGADAGANYFEKICRTAPRPALEVMAADLETYRRRAGNFYHRVRAIFFLEALHRYFLPPLFAADAFRLWTVDAPLPVDAGAREIAIARHARTILDDRMLMP